MSPRTLVVLAALLGGLAVAAGAFGAHGLRDRVDAGLLAAFETGARYQMFHALALLGLAWAVDRWPDAGLGLAGWLFVAGTVLFSGSLYAMTLSGVRALGAVTPFGGVCLIAGWAVLAWRAATTAP
jgi:uncharacterized membrane protein YgdD (TMEM256/DUF423 family)